MKYGPVWHDGTKATRVTPWSDSRIESGMARPVAAMKSELKLGEYCWRLWKRMLARPNAPVFIVDKSVREMRYIAGHTSRPSAIQRLLIAIMRGLAKTPLFSPMVYLVAALAILPLARGRAAIMLASGTLLAFALAIVTWDAEYRYMTWTIVATAIGVVLAIRQRMR